MLGAMGAMGARFGGKEARTRPRDSVGSARAAKAAKAKASSLASVFKCGEVGHRKQDCTKVGAIDDDIPLSDAPTYHVESVWDIGNVDVHGGWQVKMNPKKVSPAWCPPGLTRTAFSSCPGHGTRVAAAHAPANGCRFQALQEEEEFPESADLTCMVCGVDDEKLTREAQLEFCEADVRKPLASAVRVAKGRQRHLARCWLH